MSLTLEVHNLNIKKSPTDARDFIYKNNNPVPETYDMRPQLQPIRNQGMQGSCLAFSTACMKEYQELKDYKFNEYMSPQFFYDNRPNLYDDNENNDEGMFGRDAMKMLQKIGICTEKEYPYGDIKNKDIIDKSIYESALKHTCKQYGKLYTISELKTALIENGPCLICFPVYNHGKEMWKPLTKNSKFLGGHAMTVVGYNENEFIIRNSWGKDWGEKGYCFYPYNQWGSHWEIWTTIDDISKIEDLNIDKKEKDDNHKKKIINNCLNSVPALGCVGLIILCFIFI